MEHAQKPDFVFRRNGRVHLNRRGRQFSRLMAAEVCASAVVMLDTPCSEVVCRVLATHSIRQFPLHFPSRASPCTITFKLESTAIARRRASTVQIIPSSVYTFLINPLKTKRRPLYLKTQSVPRCKHFSSRLYKPISLWCKRHKSLFVFR